MTPQEASILQYASIPQVLKDKKQWVLYNDKKIPLTITGKPASTTNPDDWCEFALCVKAICRNPEVCGVGYVFRDGDGLVGIDLDNCFKRDGSLKSWAFRVLSTIGCGYVEYSPSGKGLHIFVLGTKKGTKCKRVIQNASGEQIGEVELYSKARYFTVTGHVFDESLVEIIGAQQQLDFLYDMLWPEDVKEKEDEPASEVLENIETRTIAHETSGSSSESIESIILRGTQGERFSTLLSGTLEEACSKYMGDHSRAVYGFSAIVAFYTQDFSECDRLFRKSALYCDKWAPDGTKVGAKGSEKWSRLGKSQFEKLRGEYERKGDVYSAATGRTSPGTEFSDLTEEGKKEELSKSRKDFQKYIDLLSLEFSEVRRDLISETLQGKGLVSGKWEGVFTRGTILALKGHAQGRKGLKTGKLENYLGRYERELQPQLLVDVPEWDGDDRIGFMAGCVSLDEGKGLGREAFEYFLKDWMSKLWGKIVDPENVQNRCLILSGVQGIGKDVWVKGLLCGLERYLADFSFDGKMTKESDIGVVMGSSLCMFISEFDKTADLGVGALKDIITKSGFTQVRKYDRDASTLVNRCSVIGACNPENVFRDVTGNRRFLVFRAIGEPGEAIKWDYPRMDRGFSLQCIAQAKWLFETGFKSDAKFEKAMAEDMRERTPDDPSVDLVEEFEAAISRLGDPMIPGNGLFTIEELEDVFGILSRNFSIPRRTVLIILKGAGCRLRTKKRKYYGSRYAVKRGLLDCDKILIGESESEDDTEIQ